MLKLLEPYFPEHAQTVVEPFAGGASASLAMLLAGRAEQIVLNDMDPGVHAFWNVLLSKPESFLGRLASVCGTKEAFLEAKAMLDHPEMASEMELAIAFITANQLAFSGITKAGLAGDYKKRWNYEKLRKRIKAILPYRDQITLLQEDALDVLEEYYWDKDNFLFVDPPYVMQGKKLYRKWYELEDHERLSDRIRELTCSYPGCAKVVVTYDDCKETEELYAIPYANKHLINRRYSCGCSRKEERRA